MPAYRVFLQNRSGHIEAREELEARSDDEAIERGREIFAQRMHHAGFEVWQRGRVIHRQAR